MNERYIEAPNTVKDHSRKSIFLAGGITGCPNWQADMASVLLKITDLVVFNPRRENFPMGDPNAGREQIKWEYDHLRLADYILFWFPSETICPIVLYELGAWSMTDKPIFVGIDPNYVRQFDVEQQTQLVRPDIEIVYSLFGLAGQIEKINGI